MMQNQIVFVKETLFLYNIWEQLL